MKFLRGLAVSLLSLLLFASLSIFSLVFTLNSTVLNPDFLVSQLNRLDLSSLTGEMLSEQIPQEQEFMAEVIEDTVAELEPWVKEQAGVIIYSGLDYFRGESQSLNVIISLEPVRESLKNNIRKAVLESPPPELAGMPPVILLEYVDDFYEEISQGIPETFELNESLWGVQNAQVVEQVRKAISYFQPGFYGLIGFMVLLILGMFLISRQIKDTSRSLGITLLTYGAIGYAGIFVANKFTPTFLEQPGLPSSIQAWIPQFLREFYAPLEGLSLGIAIAGVVLIIVSVIYRREPVS